jgi:hypothetical protein
MIGFCFSLIVSYIFYKITESHLKDDCYDDNLTDLKTLISLEKKITKNKATDEHKQKHKDTHEMLEKKLTMEDDQGKKKNMKRNNQLKFTSSFVKLSDIRSDDKDSAINKEGDEEAESHEVKLMKLEKEVDDL